MDPDPSALVPPSLPRWKVDLVMVAPGLGAPALLYLLFATAGFVALVVSAAAATLFWVVWAQVVEWRLVQRFRKSPFDPTWLPE